MDSLAFRFANALVGNPEDAAGLEITLTGDAMLMLELWESKINRHLTWIAAQFCSGSHWLNIENGRH